MRALWILAICVLASWLPLARAADAQTSPPPSIEALDRGLAAIFAQGHVPGASVVIIEKGQVALAKGYGFADVAQRRPATADTPFRAGSVSKALTAIAVMTLVERGKLSLDQPVAPFVREANLVNPWEASDPVRLANVLEHTAGWSDIGPRIEVKDDSTWSTLQGVEFANPYVSRWAPGRFTAYDNAGPPVAALIVERVTGESFEDYVREAVLRPLGMATADFQLTPELQARVARSYGSDGTVTPYQNIVLRPAGALTISARELAQLVRFYLGRGSVDGKQILSPAAVERIEHGQTNLGRRFGFTEAYGLGDMPFPDTGVTFRGHNGQIDGFSTVVGYTTRNGSGYVLMANGGRGVDFGQPAAHLIQAYLTRDLPLDPAPTFRMSKPQLARYAGIYRPITPPNALVTPFTQTLKFKVVEAGDGKLVINGSDWLPVGPHVFRRADRETPSLAFVEDAGRTYKIGVFDAEEKQPLWRLVAIWGVAAFLLLSAIFGLVMLIPWLIGAVRGRLAQRGGLAIRIVPLVGVLVVFANYMLVLTLVASGSMSGLRELARIGPVSIGILALSLLYPICGALSAVLTARTRAAPPIIRLYSGVTSIALLCTTGYAMAIGWFAMRTWQM